MSRLIFLLLITTAPPLFSLELDAKLTWAKQVTLSTPLSGKITFVHVKPGQPVTKNMALVRLDSRPLKLQIAKANAEIQRWQPIREEAQREQTRAQTLYEQTLLSEHDLQLKKQAYLIADADFQKAKISLKQAQLKLEYSIIRAPFAGTIIQRLIEPEQTITNHCQITPLIILANTQQLIASAWTNEPQTFTIGQTVTIHNDNNRIKHMGKVIEVGLEMVNQRFLIKAIVTPKTPLYAGQSATLTLP